MVILEVVSLVGRALDESVLSTRLADSPENTYNYEDTSVHSAHKVGVSGTYNLLRNKILQDT